MFSLNTGFNFYASLYKIFLKMENISVPGILLLNIMKYMVLPILYSAFGFRYRRAKYMEALM